MFGDRTEHLKHCPAGGRLGIEVHAEDAEMRQIFN